MGVLDRLVVPDAQWGRIARQVIGDARRHHADRDPADG